MFLFLYKNHNLNIKFHMRTFKLRTFLKSLAVTRPLKAAEHTLYTHTHTHTPSQLHTALGSQTVKKGVSPYIQKRALVREKTEKHFR